MQISIQRICHGNLIKSVHIAILALFQTPLTRIQTGHYVFLTLRNKATDNMFSQLAIKHSIHHLCRGQWKDYTCICLQIKLVNAKDNSPEAMTGKKISPFNKHIGNFTTSKNRVLFSKQWKLWPLQLNICLSDSYLLFSR